MIRNSLVSPGSHNESSIVSGAPTRFCKGLSKIYLQAAEELEEEQAVAHSTLEPTLTLLPTITYHHVVFGIGLVIPELKANHS